jgi:pectate lyase
MVTEDSRNITLHHNLIYGNYKRNPLIQSSDVDMVNNVIVNQQYQAYIQPFKAKVRANFVGNYFRSYRHKRPPIRVYDFNKGYDSKSGVYYEDNYDSVYRFEDNQTQTDIRVLHVSKGVEDSDGHVKDKKVPYLFAKVERQPVHTAYSLVLDLAGAIYPKRDLVDKRVVNFVKSGKAPSLLVNSPKDVGGWAILKGGVAPIDSDHDGMPDNWEKEHGLNPNNPKDGNSKNLNSIGYTNLEVYLNSLVDK